MLCVSYRPSINHIIKSVSLILFCLSCLIVGCQTTKSCNASVKAQHKPPILTAAAVIEVYEGTDFQGIVLIDRGKAPWGKALPGGKVEYGETVEQAIRREMMEEVNLELHELRQFHVYSASDRDFRHHSVEVNFLAKAYAMPKAGDDAAKAYVIKLEDVSYDKMAFDHDEIIRDYLSFKSGETSKAIIH